MIYDYLPTYHQLEPNNLKGLQPGFVVAQMEVKEGFTLLKDGLNGAKLFENGHLCSISEEGICEWAEGKPLFIHFTEEINTVLPSNKYFAVNVAEENPRLVQLIPGDEWMTDIDYETDAKYADIKDALMAHVKKVTKNSKMSKDDWFAMEELADGTKGYHYIYLG